MREPPERARLPSAAANFKADSLVIFGIPESRKVEVLTFLRLFQLLRWFEAFVLHDGIEESLKLVWVEDLEVAHDLSDVSSVEVHITPQTYFHGFFSAASQAGLLSPAFGSLF
ncbi:MAG TPA: hypothetical protein VJ837_00870 [Candidatus Paceibacterota bacterium]|nr:hypothetical protein [Candidatus Paceibacterota bacterium]